ncbi:MAG: hypothetical protein PHY59_08020 [Methanobacterium sp.]|nr:hypothetical protein [Methanobacterium sp.]
MIKLGNTLFIVLIMFIIILSLFFVSIGASSSLNETNNINISNKLQSNAGVNAVGYGPSVSIKVTPQNLILGTMVDDGLEKSFLNSIQIELSASQ